MPSHIHVSMSFFLKVVHSGKMTWAYIVASISNDLYTAINGKRGSLTHPCVHIFFLKGSAQWKNDLGLYCSLAIITHGL